MNFRLPLRLVSIVFFSVAIPWLAWAQDSVKIIQKGETLYSIAKQNNVRLDELMKLNGISDPSKIKVGQKIQLPSKDSQSTIVVDSQPAKATPEKTNNRYIVKAGDTLYSIAKNNGIELKQLLSDNKLTKDSILKPGQKLSLRGEIEKTNPKTPVRADTPVAVATPSPSPSSSTTSSELSGEVTSGTSFQKTAYTQGNNLSWPSAGERYTLNGKLPGILIKAQKGEPVRSVNTGKVVYSGPHSTFGHIVFVQSPDGFIYIYGGNESSPLKTGEIVHVGDIIGTVGITPGIQEPQVYFSVWKDGSYINPASVLRS